jgi:hypothetical protein
VFRGYEQNLGVGNSAAGWIAIELGVPLADRKKI